MAPTDDELREHYEALDASREAGDGKGVAAALGNLGRALSAAGQKERAVLLFESALTLHRALGDGWGIFLDLLTQGEELLGMPNQLITALAGYTLAHEAALAVGAPEAEQVEARVEVVLRQLSDKLPEQGAQLRKALEDDAEALRAQGVQLLLESNSLAAAFFDDQLSVARILGDSGGVIVSLGSQVKVLIDGGELQGALAALLLAEAAAAASHGLPQEILDAMLGEWREGLDEAAKAEGKALENLRKGIGEEGFEAARAAALARAKSQESEM